MSHNSAQQDFSTSNPQAVSSLSRGIESYNRWRVDVVPHLDAALEADPDCVMAHAVKGLFMVGGRNNRFAAGIEKCLSGARNALAGASASERAYVSALEALSQGRMGDALMALEVHIAGYPTDLFAHRAIQQELFWQGEVRWMREIADRAAPAWDESTPGYSTFLSVRAFGHEETGSLDRAERFAREAVALDPADCWGAHAVAHVLEMRGDSATGIEWLEGLSANWEGLNQIAHHVWWHLCLFLLERGEHERALQLLGEKVRNLDSPLVQAAPDAYIDIQNVASLLVRLELRGVDVGDAWEPVAEVAAGRIGNHASPFTSAHAAMILAATGRDEETNCLLESMEALANRGHGALADTVRVAALPAARAAVAHRRGDFQQVVDLLMPARRDLWRMGASHAQRDVFTQLLLDACVRLGLRAQIAIVLDEAASAGFAHVRQRSGYAQAAAMLS